MKPALASLVGWGRRPEHPVLNSRAAYDAAYDKLLAAL